MKRTMIYLPDEVHQGLRKLAFDRNSSIAELIRIAVEKVYGEDIEDIRDMETELTDYKAHPETAIGFDELRNRKKVSV
jgi:predicted DNA-binding protein